LLRRRGDLFLLQWAEFEGAFLAVAAADWDRATAAIETAIEVNRASGYPHCTAWYMTHLGWLARLRGRDDEAIAVGRRAVDLSDQHEHHWWQAATRAMLGDTLLVSGDRTGAVTLYKEGLTAARKSGIEAYLLRCAAPLAAATGSRALLAEAAGLLDQASIPDGGAWMLGYEAYLSLAADGRALARLGQREQARAALQRAVRLAGQHGLPHVLREASEARQHLG
jgi:tetratricopeptide (TPR) repeat protein